MINFFQKNKNGFTLLFASMVAGLLLAVGAAIISITIKQVALSAAGRESQFAFYNADTGTECALYLYRNSKHNDTCPAGIFPEVGDSSNDSSCASSFRSNPPSCLETKINVSPTGFDYNHGIYNFSVNNNNVCFDITIDKQDNLNHTTKIISKGYSNCTPGSTNVFERAIEVDF